MPISIRPLKQSEYIETSRITLECMRADYTFLPSAYLEALTLKDELAMFEAWIQEAGSPAQVFGAFVDDQMVGYVAVSPNSGEPVGYEGEVNHLFVRAGFRGLGISLLLLEAGLVALRRQGHKTVILYNYRPSASNGYYRHLGGEVVFCTVQSPGGMSVEIDVFGWETDHLLQTVHEHLKKYL